MAQPDSIPTNAIVFQIPPDKYRFREVLFSVLMLPCVAAWLYVLIFHVSSFLVAMLLAGVFGLGTAFVATSGICLLGHTIVDSLDSWLGRGERK